MSRTERPTSLLKPATAKRQKYEFCVVLCVRAPSWKDGLLSRFIAEDKRMQEGREQAEVAHKAMREAGLTIKVKKHSPKDGSRLLMVFVTAELNRLEKQHARLSLERWMQEEGIGDTFSDAKVSDRFQQRAKPSNPFARVRVQNPFAPVGSEASTLQPLQAFGGEDGASSSADAALANEPPRSDFRPSAAHRVELLDHILRTPVGAAGGTRACPGHTLYGPLFLGSGGSGGSYAPHSIVPRPLPSPDAFLHLPGPAIGPPPSARLASRFPRGNCMHAAASPASRARLEAQCAKRGECSCPLLQVEQGGAGLEALQKADDAAGRRRTIVHIYPLRDAHFNRALRRRAKRVNPFFGDSLEDFLRDVRSMYGEKVAFYYAFNAHYTMWLVWPSAVGAFLFVLSFIAQQQVQQFSPFFAAFMAIWGAAFCKAWKRRANRLALEWGTLNRREIEVVRKAFYGWPRTSPITGELEAAYPEWRRALKYMVTVVVIGLQVISMCCWVAVLYFGYFYIQSTDMELWRQFLLNGINSTIWGISLEFLNFIIFYQIAVLLNNFENHRTVQIHENRLIAKIFTFYFIDCFLWFFLLAFFQIPFGAQIDQVMNTTMHVELDKPFQREIWMSRLGLTIGAVLSLTQWSMVFFADAYVPNKLRNRLLKRRAKGRAPQKPPRAQVGPTSSTQQQAPSLELPPIRLDDISPDASPNHHAGAGAPAAAGASGSGGQRCAAASSSSSQQAESDPHERMSELLDQASMAPYDPMLDYCGIVIQFGYVTFFSVVWQLAPLVCLLHTMFRRNSNLLRLDKLSMRPLPEPSGGIGLWDLLLKFTAYFAVLINCMIVSVSTDQLDYFSCYSHSLFRDQGECHHGNVPMTSRFLIALIAGYVILAIVFLIDNMLPDQQNEVTLRLKKAAYMFKRRYTETIAAEQAMQGGGGGGGGAAVQSAVPGNLRVTGFRVQGAINYDSDWGSGSDLSDAWEEDVAGSDARTY